MHPSNLVMLAPNNPAKPALEDRILVVEVSNREEPLAKEHNTLIKEEAQEVAHREVAQEVAHREEALKEEAAAVGGLQEAAVAEVALQEVEVEASAEIPQETKRSHKKILKISSK